MRKRFPLSSEPSPDSLRLNKRLMAYSAAGMYGGAAFLGVIEDLIPGSPSFSITPGLVALGVAALLVGAGPRLPRGGLALLGPIGAGLIAAAVAGQPGAGDAAVLYMFPVLWTTFFFGPPGAIAIVGCVGLAHGVALLSLPAHIGYFDRWVDVIVSVSVVTAVVHVLARRNDELLARLADEARTDRLTGLLNRRGFEERSSLELAHAKRGGDSIAVASFDIDYFKRVNDEWGHETGDRVLARLGRVLASGSRDVDVVARIGGEEFVAVLPGAGTVETDAFTQRVRRALAVADASGLPRVTVSAGVAAATAPESLEVLLQRADSALYAAKRAGRDQTVTLLPEQPSLEPVASSMPTPGRSFGQQPDSAAQTQPHRGQSRRIRSADSALRSPANPASPGDHVLWSTRV
jgi:diguanylate cyclase (GGDEF)-like protein